MAKKSKRFRIGVEGATTDGRVIEREWLTQMAASYNPQVYTALINMEHIKGFTPDGPFRRFGMVEKLEAEEITEGALSGKMALYGWIAPTDDLVTMTSNWQKLFTSMEVNTSFADTGSAYLVGLAITDELAKKNSQLISLSILTETNSRAQTQLYAAAEETSALLRSRQRRIEELKRENEDLRRWADTPLPADIIRLRERPALAGGAPYREWLSKSDAMPPGQVGAAQ
ncbi:Rz-like lysis system protein LysB [Enterobacter bugandensis]|uniref:Rz-like lysis system protein LysB n=1 Tax=Enterobacter bugandensis TaxID=881260 RepID=UPI00300C7841